MQTPRQTAIRELVTGDEPLTIQGFAGGHEVGAADVLKMAESLGVRMVDLKFTDVPGTWQHMTLAARQHRRGRVQRRPRLRRLLDPRLPADRGVGHAADARPEHGDDRPLLRGAHALADLQHPRPDHARGLLARPALRRAEGRAPPPRDGDRGHRFLRPRGRVLRLRARRLRPAEPLRLLRGRLAGGLLEHGRGLPRGGQPRPQDPLAGGLLPRAAVGHARRPARDDGDGPRVARHLDGVPPPRGRRAGAGRDRPALRTAAADGRHADDAQVRRQELRARGRQDRHLHAEAGLRGERLGDARAPVALEGRRDADVRRERLRAALRARAQLRRRNPRPRPRADGLLRADDELLPAARARASRLL